jgi:hypothetical protein
MFKTSFVSAFALTLISYAIFVWLQPSVPLSITETTVVFAFWFGIAALVRWLVDRRQRRKNRGH